MGKSFVGRKRKEQRKMEEGEGKILENCAIREKERKGKREKGEKRMRKSEKGERREERGEKGRKEGLGNPEDHRRT